MIVRNQKFVEQAVNELAQNPELDKYALDIAHTPNGAYLLDSIIYGSSVSRRSGVFELCYEPAISAVMSDIGSCVDVFIDIGANIGYHTICISPLVDQVYAIEPSKPLFNLLNLNLKLSGCQNIKVDRYAFSDSSESVSLDESTVYTNENDHFPVITFDSYFDNLGIIHGNIMVKLDVDGFEGRVAAGMKKFLAQNSSKTSIVMEITPQNMRNFGTEPGVFFDFFDGLGFKLFQIDEGGLFDRTNNTLPICVAGREIAHLVPLESLRQIRGKEVNCVLTHINLSEIHSRSPYLKKKQSIIDLVDTRADIEDIAQRIVELGNPFFLDQWQRFSIIAYRTKVRTSYDDRILENFHAYQLRKAWTRWYMGDTKSAKELFSRILDCNSNPLIWTKAFIGLYKIGNSKLHDKILKKSLIASFNHILEAVSQKFPTNDASEFLRILYLLNWNEFADSFAAALPKKTDNENDSQQILSKVGPMMDKKGGAVPNIRLLSRKFIDKYAKRKFPGAKLKTGLPISIQARYFDPLNTNRKNRIRKILFGLQYD